jgi:hypothetical protein
MSGSTLNVVIAERGWVFVGWCHREGDQLVIERCFNCRRWGTTSGLGQLAKEGPQSATVLDDYGTVRIHVLAIAATIECDPAAWAPKGKRK